MQIHELTRRKTNEGLLGSLATGIASQVGKQTISKAFGGTDVTNQPGPYQSRDQGFQSMVNSPAAAALSKSMQGSWAQVVQNFLANSVDAQGNPATNLKAVTNPSVDSLKQQLTDLVNKMLGSGNAADYKTLANNVDDPVAKQGIQEVISRINEYTEAIFKATVQGVDPKIIAADWIKLVGEGILPAQNAQAYDVRKAGGSSRPKFGEDSYGNMTISIDGGAYEPFLPQRNPKHKKIADLMLAGKLR